MNSLRIGLLGSATKVGALTLFAASAACSSSSTALPTTPSPAKDGGGTLTGPGPTMDGTGAACTVLTKATVATKVSLNVDWPGTGAVAAVPKSAPLPLSIWLLSIYNIDSSNKVTGSTQTCGNKTPPITLSMLGDTAESAPAGSQVQITFAASSWDGTPLTPITGTLGGWKTGATVTIDPTVTVYGVSPSSALAMPSAMWPGPNTSGDNTTGIPTTELTYADGGAYQAGVGVPGIVAVPLGTSPYYLPTTSLSGPPSADQLDIVLRTELSLYGTSSSCTEQTGEAFVPELNNRVVGCRLANDGGVCTPAQWGFIDQNTTQYVPVNGTFDSKTIAEGATCADVLTALP